MTADELEYLKLLVDKHKEVSSAYYTRMNVFLGILVVLLTSAALLITQASTPHPRLFWSSLGVIGLVGLGLAFIMAKVLKTSAQWIDFWHAKIVYFEARHADDGQTRFFFLDRKLSKPELLVRFFSAHICEVEHIQCPELGLHATVYLVDDAEKTFNRSCVVNPRCGFDLPNYP